MGFQCSAKVTPSFEGVGYRPYSHRLFCFTTWWHLAAWFYSLPATLTLVRTSSFNALEMSGSHGCVSPETFLVVLVFCLETKDISDTAEGASALFYTSCLSMGFAAFTD